MKYSRKMQRLHELQVNRGLKHDKELASTMKLAQIRLGSETSIPPDSK